MYVFIFVLLVIFERNGDYNMYTLDARLEKAWNGWNRLSEP